MGTRACHAAFRYRHYACHRSGHGVSATACTLPIMACSLQRSAKFCKERPALADSQQWTLGHMFCAPDAIWGDITGPKIATVCLTKRKCARPMFSCRCTPQRDAAAHHYAAFGDLAPVLSGLPSWWSNHPRWERFLVLQTALGKSEQ